MDERIGFVLYQSCWDRGSVGHVSVLIRSVNKEFWRIILRQDDLPGMGYNIKLF